MVPLLLMPISATATQQLSSSSLPDRTAEEADSSQTTENVSGVRYQLGRRHLNSNKSDYKRKSFYWGSSESTMTTSVTMAVGMGMMVLFLLVNVSAIEAAAESHNKYSFNSSNSVFMSHQPQQQQQPATTYSHRLKGLDRILNRLDGNRGDSNNGFTSNTKDHYQSPPPPPPLPPSNHQQLHRRFLSGGSTGNGNGMSITSSMGGSGGATGSGTDGKSGSHHRSPSPSFPALSSLTGLSGGFKTPGKTYFDAGEDEDLDEELDDDDSYEETDDEDNHDDDVLNDKMTNWAQSYKSRYLAQRKTPPTTTTTTTTTTTPTPTTSTTTTPAPPPPLSYSQWKWQNLGTRQGLEQYRRHQMSSGGGGSSSSSSSINSNSIYPSNSNGNGNHGGVSPYRQVGHHYNSGSSSSGGNSRYYGSNTNVHPSYSAYSSSSRAPSSSHPSSSSSSSSSSQGSSWTGGSNRAQPQTPGAAISEAVRHALKVRKEASCSVPQPRVVRVQDSYPHPGKTYVPHCTILHQCSDDTGCCRHDTLTCAPKTTQRVELAFYTITLDQSRAPTVDRLVFYNHTECECRDKLDEMMPRDQPDQASSSSSHTSSLLTMPSVSPSPTSQFLDPYAMPNSFVSRRNAVIDSNSIDVGGTSCKCSSTFNERVLSDGSCSCDCFDKEKSCLRLKRGRDFFPLSDKWCIQSGRCEVPECAYGPYIHLIGRCPRKRERAGQTTSWTRYLTS